jgi:hypothetical protein
MQILTDEEIQTLNEARGICKRLTGWKYFRERKDEFENLGDDDAWRFGMLSECAENTGDAIFNLLNTINAHFHQGMTNKQLHP